MAQTNTTFNAANNFSMDDFLAEFFHVQGADGRSLPQDEMMSSHGGRYLPFDRMLTRDMSAGVFGQGGALVSTGVDSKVVPYLRSRSVCGKLGAEFRLGLKPSERLPVLQSDFTATWLPEYGTAPEGDLSVAQMLLSPHRISISLTASEVLGIQSNAPFGAMIATQALDKLMQAVDQAALTGTGGVMPLGITQTAGVGQVTFGGAATWVKILSFESIIGNSNADGPSLGWAQSPNTRARWKAIQRASGTSTFLQDDSNNRVNGYPAAMTTELNTAAANDACVFGNFSDLVIGIFGNGCWVNFNPYTLSPTGEQIYTFHMYVDMGPRHPASFVISTDSAAQ